MNRSIVILIFLTLSLLIESSAQQRTKRKIFEVVHDSTSIIETHWVADSVEFAGNGACEHQWVGNEYVWDTKRQTLFEIQRDSTVLRSTEPRRILPRICTQCLRKEFLLEQKTERKVESKYSKLQKQMLLKKPR